MYAEHKIGMEAKEGIRTERIEPALKRKNPMVHLY